MESLNISGSIWRSSRPTNNFEGKDEYLLQIEDFKDSPHLVAMEIMENYTNERESPKLDQSETGKYFPLLVTMSAGDGGVEKRKVWVKVDIKDLTDRFHIDPQKFQESLKKGGTVAMGILTEAVKVEREKVKVDSNTGYGEYLGKYLQGMKNFGKAALDYFSFPLSKDEEDFIKFLKDSDENITQPQIDSALKHYREIRDKKT